MFTHTLVWLRDLICGKKEPVAPPRLDEFHKATYPELFNAAWTIVTVTPPTRDKSGKSYIWKELTTTCSTQGARIEFNNKGEGRVLTTTNCGLIDISMENLPCRVRWNPSRMCLKPTEKQSREFFTRLMDKNVPAMSGGMESSAKSII